MPSPPLPTVALAPPPSNLTLTERRAQRQRQRATLPSQMPSTLATPASLLFSSAVHDSRGSRSIPSQATACHYVVDAPLSSVSSVVSGPPCTHQLHRHHQQQQQQQEDDTASVLSTASSVSHRSATLSPVPVSIPRLKSPLPPQYRYPSPAPSLASSISTATSTSTCASASSHASITSTSTGSSTSTSTSGSLGHSKDFSASHRRRKTITAADDPVVVIGRSDSATTVTAALMNPPTPTDPTTIRDTGRGRGRSFSRSVRKVASVFNLLKKDDIPSVPEVPAAYR